MKGHIRERSPGHWAIVVEMRDPETGRRKRKWHSFSGTKRQAQDECARLISELKGRQIRRAEQDHGDAVFGPLAR
jgi:hypothetical protein